MKKEQQFISKMVLREYLRWEDIQFRQQIKERKQLKRKVFMLWLHKRDKK